MSNTFCGEIHAMPMKLSIVTRVRDQSGSRNEFGVVIRRFVMSDDPGRGVGSVGSIN